MEGWEEGSDKDRATTPLHSTPPIDYMDRGHLDWEHECLAKHTSDTKYPIQFHMEDFVG